MNEGGGGRGCVGSENLVKRGLKERREYQGS